VEVASQVSTAKATKPFELPFASVANTITLPKKSATLKNNEFLIKNVTFKMRIKSFCVKLYIA
jgi:hypothetical protein